MKLVTPRLTIEPVAETADPRELLRVFNSNPDFIEASEPSTGKRAYGLADVEMYLWQETARENSRCLAIRLRGTGQLVGTAALVAPHWKEPYPWIGLLLIDAAYQRLGLGTEAALAIEQWLVGEGWTEVRLGVIQGREAARRFWERLGYTVYDERPDDYGRSCWRMRKPLAAAAE